jgi:hypothetical protein
VADKRGRGGGRRDTVTLKIEAAEVEAQVWSGTAGWNATALIEGREFRIMSATDREDALARLRSAILDNVEATRALGVKTRRYWSPNPYWKGH